MNNELFLQYHFARKNLLILVNYYDISTKKSTILVLCRNPEDYSNLSEAKSIRLLSRTSDDRLTEKEVTLKNLLLSKNFISSSNIYLVKNTIITQESSLIDVKKNLALFLYGILNDNILDEQLYLEEWNTRRPMENYISPIRILELDITKFNIEPIESEVVYIDDMLLKNIPFEEDILGINVYDIVKLLNAIAQTRDDLLENRKDLAKYLKTYWLKIPDEQINNIIRESKLTDEYIDEKLELLQEFSNLAEQEGAFNEILWKIDVERGVDVLNKQDINFNGFILENKQNQLENNKKLDTYSIFKYFELNADIPFSRYSYGNQVANKIVKIYENFYTVENLKYLEAWTKISSYKDTPSNCIQWMGFATINNSRLLYEIILFSDGVYQVRLYQQKINLANISVLLENLRNDILLKIKTILLNSGVEFVLDPFVLGENIYFVFSKLEIEIELNKDILLAKLQNVLNKSIYLFNKIPGLMANEFTNIEFKKVNNYTRTDQVLKYITHFIIQGRLNPRNDDMTPLVKQLMSKYKKNAQESMEILQNWVSKFMTIEDQQIKKTKISKSIGLEVVGKEMGSNIVNFYMSNVIQLDDINTFFYYISMMILLSQLDENTRLYKSLMGKKVDEKLVAKVDEIKEQEQPVLELLEEPEIMFDPAELLDLEEEEQALGEGEEAIDVLELIMGAREESQGEVPALGEEPKGPQESEDEGVGLDEEPEEEPVVNLNGNSYYIRRLQQMDKEVYDYKIHAKFAPYSKKAMPNDSRQPVILTNRQMNKIKERYGDDTNVYGGVDEEVRERIESNHKLKVPGYSIKYRNLHYICPKVWCMACQLPFYMRDLVNAEIGEDVKKGEILINPSEVTCPECGGAVWDKSKRPDGTLLIARDNLGRQPYPGFFTKDNHPKDLCMVACFKTAYQKVDECLNEATPFKEIKKIKTQINQRNILKGDKYGICNYNRYCELPKVLHNWINSDHGDSKLSVKITDEFTSILRRGIQGPDDEYYHTFELTLKYLFGEKTNKFTTEEFRTYLVDKLKATQDIDNIFRRCRKGSYYLYFNKDIENYYNYLLNTISLQPRFVLPLFGTPGILENSGINFYILREESDLIYLECEYLYNLHRDGHNLFIYNHSLGDKYKKQYYEPIVLVQQKMGIISAYRTINNERILNTFREYINTQCKSREDPWISDIKRSSRNLIDNYFLDKESTESILKNILKTTGEFQIMAQYVNDYNQSEGLVIKWIPRKKWFYLPVQPIEIIKNFRIIENKQLIKLKSLQETVQFLHRISELANIIYTPKFYTLNNNRLISGVYSNTGYWIPVPYISLDNAKEFLDSLGNNKLDEWKLLKDDWFDLQNRIDQRITNRQLRDTKRYNYEKLRYELSKLVNSDMEFKDQIIGFMRRYKTMLPIDEKNQIRKDLVDILSNYLRTHLVIPGIIGEWNMKDIFTYCKNNESMEQCNSSSMCKWITNNNTCKMIVSPEWYWKYISKIVDEILVNVNKKREIMDGYRKELETPENEYIFYSKEEVDEYLEKYDYNLENKKFMYHPLEHYDFTNPKKILTDEYLQKRAVDKQYKIPNYLKNLFIGQGIIFKKSAAQVAKAAQAAQTAQAEASLAPKDLTIYVSKESGSNYFFSNLEFVIKKLEIKPMPIRAFLSEYIRNTRNPLELLDKYKSLAQVDEIYRKFTVFKTIKELADYVNEYSWGSLVDLELMARGLSKHNVRFIIIEDTNNPNNREVFVHLPNHLRGLTLENLGNYIFVVFIKHDNIYELVLKKASPLFKANDLAFIVPWVESQIKFETRITY
jgi:hypothetical protein